MTDSDSDALELASAYLDGEVTAAERARVEGDPELLAEVERLRQVQRAVAEIPSSSPSASREAAISAALAAFDELGDDVPAAPPNVVSLADRRKARWMQVLGAAAAAVVVIAGGFAIANREGGDDGSADQFQSEELATAGADGTAELAAEAPAMTAVAVPVRATAPATLPEETSSDFGMATDQPLAAAPMETAEAEPALDAAAAPGPATAITPPVVHDEAELRSVAESLTTEPPALDDVVANCGTGAPEPDATFDDGQGVVVEVIVATTPDGFAAVSIKTCEIVLRVAT